MNVNKMRWISFWIGVGGFVMFFGGVFVDALVLGILGMIAIIVFVIMLLCTFSAGEEEEEEKEEPKRLEKLYKAGEVIHHILTICKEFYSQMPFNVTADTTTYRNCIVYSFQVKGRQFDLEVFYQDAFGRSVDFGEYVQFVKFSLKNLMIQAPFMINDVMEGSFVVDFLKKYEGTNN